MKLTNYGFKEWFGGGVIALILIAPCLCLVFYWGKPVIGYSLAGFVALVYISIAAFFRDPFRAVPEEANILVSPADGVIRDIELIKGSEENGFFKDQGVVRVGIFLSVLDVHLNRAPCELTVEDKVYRKGKYHDARNTLASKENEAMTISCHGIVAEKTFPLMIRQISGAIAKRIVCKADKGTKLTKGEKFGMIKFGSRTELFIPAEQWLILAVKVGDKVYAGKTVVAKIIPTETAEAKQEK